ncbi:hypothetical protein DITRI_Ditri07aG0099000 [Diplodiscus trichospermus]
MGLGWSASTAIFLSFFLDVSHKPFCIWFYTSILLSLSPLVTQFQLGRPRMAAVSDLSGIQNKWEFSCDLEVDFESEEYASIVYAALDVDKELQPDKVKRQMSISDGKLSVHFAAVEARFLRASFSAFVDVLTLATKTIEEFGPGMEL